MAPTGKTRKRTLIKKSEKGTKKKLKTKNQATPKVTIKHAEQKFQEEDFNEEVDSDESNSEKLSSLLEPYSRDQLIDLICDASLKDAAFLNRVQDIADRDVSYRKIFVHGLSWDTTRETLTAIFEPFGCIEECNVVLDKNTGKAKGYGFVLYKKRRAAIKALKNPQKRIMNRIASCQLASVGPVSGGPPAQGVISTPAPRKIYVSNVPSETDPEKLRAFFCKFGEIETGPIGFDTQTGKSRGFALFVYKTPEGLRKALQEPHKMFNGHQLHCQKATEGKNKNQSVQPQPQPQSQSQAQAQMQPQPQSQSHPMLAMAAAQNLAMFGHNPGFNPIYGRGYFVNPAAGMIPGTVNPAMMAGTLNQGLVPTSQVGQGQAGSGVVGYSGVSNGFGSIGGGSSALGSFGSNPTPQILQALQQVYPHSQFGQLAPGRVQGTGGPITGYPSYTWYDIFQLACLFLSLFVFRVVNCFLCLLSFWLFLVFSCEKFEKVTFTILSFLTLFRFHFLLFFLF
ncbi:UBP1-associated protein 2B isoform X1 [Cannabis sativa]|uniref:UBP1-associated protein 2B isoform X1 n=2 Tax=Cannabis sativa TaxID=3483 RepID=UPI0029CA0A56|nr:UBP1-associated protein 2B isoform X1 [Cannabis sativa]